jgi:uncharacterized membrane protein YkoI
MKCMFYPLIIITLIYSAFTWALPSEAEILKYVPEGKIIKSHEKEVKLLTPSNTVVEVEFEANGDFEEASGDDVRMDSFVPGQGLLSLKEAVAAATKANKTVSGDWTLENHIFGGWTYEFEGLENNRKMEYVIDAKSGKLLKSKTDE